MSSAWDGLKNNRLVTELPHYAINRSVPEDTFFTDRAVAKRCYETFMRVAKKHRIDLSGHIFVEPSAGEGCFFDLLPAARRIGLDIQPRSKRIRKADFLRWYPSDEARYAVVGNPPFGHRGAYALAFVNRAFLFADVVAFILPMSFYSNGKGSNMKRVCDARLLHSEVLDGQSFYTPDNHEPVSVKTVFQVWKKGRGKSVFVDYDVSDFVDIFTVCSAPNRRCSMDKLEHYDCYISSTFYRSVGIVNTFEEVLYGSGYGMIIKKQKRRIKQALRQADWLRYCSDATNHCKHIRMHSIRRCLGEAGFGKKPAEQPELYGINGAERPARGVILPFAPPPCIKARTSGEELGVKVASQGKRL